MDSEIYGNTILSNLIPPRPFVDHFTGDISLSQNLIYEVFHSHAFISMSLSSVHSHMIGYIPYPENLVSVDTNPDAIMHFTVVFYLHYPVPKVGDGV